MWRRLLAGFAALLLAVTVSVVASPAPSAEAAAPAWVKTKGSKIVSATTGATFTIKATSWFGMETDTCAPHGLWSITVDQGMAQIAGMGFNTIRLPFSNECLAKRTTNSINTAINPALAGKSPLQVMDAVVASARKYGIRIILDRHRPDSAAQSELWYTKQYPEARWIADWKKLAKRYQKNSTVIGVDLHNEPRGRACWGCGERSRDWRAAATRAGNSIHTVNPRLLIIVEGVQYEQDGSVTWWGGGLRGVAKKPVSLKVKNRVVYSPHEYPLSVAYQPWFSAKNYPNNLTAIWERNWGYIATKNIAPVFVGEFGTKLETSSDKKWLAKLTSYIKTKRMGWAYWSFNPNSGDTGGLLKDDWYTRQKAKLTALKPILTPKKVAYPPAPKPTTPPQPTPTPQPSSSAQPSPDLSVGKASSASSSGTSATMTVTSAWPGAYQVGLIVTPPSKPKTTSWRASWASPGATSIESAWGMGCELANAAKSTAKVTCTVSGWALANLKDGQRVDVGVIVKAPKGPNPPKLSLAAS